MDDGRLRKASEVTIKPGSILGKLADTAHVVKCVGNAPTIGLHVYGGDIFELPHRRAGAVARAANGVPKVKRNR